MVGSSVFYLRVKAFYDTSINGVKTRIWIAVSTYALVAIIRKRLHLELNLYTILQMFGYYYSGK